MKLTNMIRDSFIRAAMADVPAIDFQVQTIKVAIDDAVDQLPVKVKALWKDKDMSIFVRCKGMYFGNSYVIVPCKGDGFKLSATALAEVGRIAAESNAQEDHHRALRSNLRAVAYSCKTRKSLVDALPEFEKYLPADDAAACRTLPVVANVVSEFVKAGWPKGTPKPKAKK